MAVRGAMAALLTLLALELVASATPFLVPDLYDQRHLILQKIEPDSLREFARAHASRVLGWDNPADKVVVARDCLGRKRTYTFGIDRTRIHSRASPDRVAVIIAGDSYTLGDEADDDETFPAVLEGMLGVPVANLGVNAYGPDQSLFKAEQLVGRYPRATSIVLAIMYEDAGRLLNSYRPVYFESSPYLFKPFMRGGAWHPLVVDNPWRDMETARRAANLAFDTDYWRKPRARFPFAISLVKALATPAFRHTFVPPRFPRLFGLPQYHWLFRDAEVQLNLVAVIERFAALAKGRGLNAVVAFIPRSGADVTSGDEFVTRVRDRYAGAVRLVNVDKDIDWSRYNLRPSGGCHPSAYGYYKIAQNVGAVVRDRRGS